MVAADSGMGSCGAVIGSLDEAGGRLHLKDVLLQQLWDRKVRLPTRKLATEVEEAKIGHTPPLHFCQPWPPALHGQP